MIAFEVYWVFSFLLFNVIWFSVWNSWRIPWSSTFVYRKNIFVRRYIIRYLQISSKNFVIKSKWHRNYFEWLLQSFPNFLHNFLKLFHIALCTPVKLSTPLNIEATMIYMGLWFCGFCFTSRQDIRSAAAILN